MSSALREHLARLRHDLGKYVALQTRGLAPGADADALQQALVADVLKTRRSRVGVESAPSIWAAYRPTLVGEQPLTDGTRVFWADDPDVVAIDRAMRVLAELVPALEANQAAPEDLARGVAASRSASDAIRALYRSRGG